MVNIGDIVGVTFYARFGFQLDPIAQPTSDLQARLQQAGFRVVKIDATALSAVTTGLTLGLGGWGWVYVTLQPTSSAYGSPADVGSIVAGAAYAVGFEVDFSQVQSSVIAVASGTQQPATVDQYLNQQQAPDAIRRTDPLDELAKTIGISKQTLILSGLAIGGLFLFLSVKK